MGMSTSVLSFIPWFLLYFVTAALQITAAVFLLKERHMGALLMLVGGIVMLLGQLGNFALSFALMMGRFGSPNTLVFTAVSAVAGLGCLLFAIGLLLHALRQRSKANRIAELEAIIASMQNR